MASELAPDELVAGKYRLTTKIGVGGLGEVWSARHTLLGGDVALKFLKPGPDASSPQAMQRFLREARAASALKNPHVCKVFDVGEHGGRPFIVLERLEGEDLGSLVEALGPQAPGLVAEIVVQACEALAESHALGIVHRDLKPENLFLERHEGRVFVKVLDFGLATSHDREAQRLTSTEATFGTPLYMSPEQLRGARQVDARSDLWSLGVVLFFATAGKYPFNGASVPALAVQIATSPAPKLATVWPAAPADFAAVVDRCLAYEPEDRFGSARDLAEALRPLARAALPSLPPMKARTAALAPTVPSDEIAVLDSMTRSVREGPRLAGRKLLHAAGVVLALGVVTVAGMQLGAATRPAAPPSLASATSPPLAIAPASLPSASSVPFASPPPAPLPSASVRPTPSAHIARSPLPRPSGGAPPPSVASAAPKPTAGTNGALVLPAEGPP